MDVPVPDLRHPQLRALYAYWDARRGQRAMPARSDIDPLDIPRHLSTLVLADVLYDPLRFRLRVVGTELERRAGRTMTGDVLHEGERPGLYRPYRTCALERRPSHDYARYDFGDGSPPGEFERLLLPLSSDGATVDRILGQVAQSRLVDKDALGPI
jgi:hypothetical protein